MGGTKPHAFPAVAGLCLSLLLPGCVLHETYGDPAEQASLAHVEGYWRYFLLYEEGLQIVSVDGRRKRPEAMLHAHSISLPAGAHWLQFAIVRNRGEVAWCAFEWTFEAGHRYRLERLRHDQGLLAHPAASPYKAVIEMDVTAPGAPARPVAAPAECATTAMCREDADCAPPLACSRRAGFDSGTCARPAAP